MTGVNIFAVIILLVLLLAESVCSESLVQEINLKQGWNAIFLVADPVWKDAETEVEFSSKEPTDPEVVFKGLTGLISVWAWNPQAGTVEYIQNPNDLIDQGPQMLVYRPDNPMVSNLHAIHGNRAYLVQMSAPATLTVRGEPRLQRIPWKPNSFNFVGFHVDEADPPLFEEFFASSPAHVGQEIYVLDNASAAWVPVDSTTRMRKGEGFWVYTRGSSNYDGPVSVQVESGYGLDFGHELTVQDIQLRNDALSDKSVSLSLVNGDSGSVPLYFWRFDPDANVAEWSPFPPGPIGIPAGESQRLRLGVRRAGLTGDDERMGNVIVTDGEGTERAIPVSVNGIDLAGLWVGTARIDRVTQRVSADNPNPVPTPTGSPFDFRLIVHVDDSGQARLLNQVYQMWREGTWKPDPDDFGRLVVDQPGDAVLFTEDALTAGFTGSTLRDGKPVGRRISAPAFGNFYVVEDPDPAADEPVHDKVMSPVGAFGQDGESLVVNLRLPADDPTNPFVHRYHPDHLPGNSDYRVDRAITMTFSDTDADGVDILAGQALGWGSADMGGVYEESIAGLHTAPIDLRGTFVLHRVSSVGTLTREAAP
jgi:hypothetical protein